MEPSTLEQLEAVLEAVRSDLTERVGYLAQKSSAGSLSEIEKTEYEYIVQLNDSLSILKLQTQQYSRLRLVS